MADCSTLTELINSIKFDDFEMESWERNRQPLGVTFEVTPKCNFRCIHCYLNNRYEQAELDTRQIKNILNILQNQGVLIITLTGGEIFTRKDFQEIYIHAKRLGFLVGLFTNGYAIKADDLEMLTEYPPLLVDISLYGASDETYFKVTGKKGAYTRVLNNCREMRKRNIPLALKTPMIKEYLHEIDQMKAVARELGAEYRFSYEIVPTLDNDCSTLNHAISLSDMLHLETTDEIRLRVGEKSAEIVNNWPSAAANGDFVPMFLCKIAVNDFFIDYQGRMCPCAGYRSQGRSLLYESFTDIWRDFAHYREIPASSDNKCIRCDSRYFCKVCPADQDEFYGDPESIPPVICAFSMMKNQYFKEKKGIDEILSSFANS